MTQLTENIECEIAASAPLPWSDAFLVGHPEIDSEHHRLVEAINEICASNLLKKDPDRLARLLKALRETTVEHFRLEDSLLSEIKSGAFRPAQDRPPTPAFLQVMSEVAMDEHIVEHDALLARLDSIVADPTDSQCTALKAWFLDHAIKHDARLKAIFQAM